jgi:hypothetical protein
MVETIIKDAYRSLVEKESAGKQTVLYDDKGQPSVMNIIPCFRVEDVSPKGMNLGSGPHPAFVVNGAQKPEIFIGTYTASLLNGRAVSLPGMFPANYTNYDLAHTYCGSKGPGWHLMTNFEWMAVSLWCLKNGYQPRGNTYWGTCHEAPDETGRRYDKRSPGEPEGEGWTATASGPASWRHDNTPYGIDDLRGNLFEWQGGLKVVNGQIIMPNDNDYNAPEADWVAQGVYYDANVTGASGIANISNTITHFSENPPEKYKDEDETSGASVPFADMEPAPGFDTLPEVQRQLLAQAGLTPRVHSGDSAYLGLAGTFFVRNYGERIPFRGGDWVGGKDAGLGSLYFYGRRSRSNIYISFRPAFIG